ncbi:ATP-binding protein [Marinifilum sp. RC60d5]|uniref:ATP-binding protein n=1 Tax=Marinifilum sp. RC60d5 TaxID=3458414 RepID=UPI0040354E9C
MHLPLKLVLLPLFISKIALATPTLDKFKKQTVDSKEEIELYLQLSKHYQSNNIDSAIIFANKALVLSMDNKDDNLLLNSYFQLFQNYSLNGDKAQSKHYLDKAYVYAVKTKDSVNTSNILLNLADYYSIKDQYDSATIYYNKCYSLSKKISLTLNHVNTLIGLGEISYERGELDQALNKYLEAYKYSENLKNDNVKISLLIDMGNIYADDAQLEKAKSYYNQAKIIAEQHKQTKVLSAIYNNLATIYQEEKKYLKAQNYFEKSLEIEKNNKYQPGIALALNNIGENYFRIGNYEKAISSLHESLSINEKLHQNISKIYNLGTLSEIYLKTGNYTQAYKYITEGIKLSTTYKTKKKKNELLFLLAKYYHKIGDNAKAYATMTKHDALKDSLLSESKTQKIAQLQAQYESEKREQENEILRVKHQYAQEKLKKEKIITNFFIVFSVIALALLILSYFLYKAKTQANLRINKINGMLEESNKKMKISNATKDKFFSIIAHDLRSPFNAILGFSGLVKDETENSKDIEAIKDYNDNIYESSHNLYTLLENLLQWANSQRGKLEFSPERFNLHQLIQANLNLFKLKANDKSIDLISDVKPETMAYGDVNMIDTIIRNLINNALKFTNINGRIELHTSFDNDFILVKVKDNGIGISKENQAKLFRPDCNFTTYGTENESGSGLGLILCKEFARKNSGDIWVKSILNKGSEFILKLKSV